MEYIKLKDLFTIKKGKKVEQINEKSEDSIRYIQIDDLRNNNNIKYCNNDSKYVIANKHDIIIAWDGANAGTVGYGLEGAIGSTLAILRKSTDEFISEFCGLFLKSKFDYLRDKCTGATIPHISKVSLEELKLPKFTLENQMKIVEVIKLSQELIDKRKAQIEALDELVKSQFIEMFGDLNSNSKGWNIINFNEFAVIDTNMTKDFEKYSDYPHIGIDSIEKNTGNILEYQLVKDSSLKSGKYLFDERHIIYSKIRPNLNKVALPWFKGVCSADAYPILCLDGIVDKNYLGYVLRSEFFLSYILAFSGRTNIPKVNKEQLKGFNMPTPPIELQNQFADFVKQTDKLKFEMEKSLKELEDNFNSLMQKAFNGQLFNK